jgi:hypothetical protein
MLFQRANVPGRGIVIRGQVSEREIQHGVMRGRFQRNALCRTFRGHIARGDRVIAGTRKKSRRARAHPRASQAQARMTHSLPPWA